MTNNKNHDYMYQSGRIVRVASLTRNTSDFIALDKAPSDADLRILEQTLAEADTAETKSFGDVLTNALTAFGKKTGYGFTSVEMPYLADIQLG